MPRASSPENQSVYSVADSSEYESEASSSTKPIKRKRPIGKSASAKSTASQPSKKRTTKAPVVEDIEEIGSGVLRPHDQTYHDVDGILGLQEELLTWFDDVREKRGMPWRKRYDDSLSMEEKGQRAYEIWVSEVMLQQTQVNTVIAYWQRWIQKWPTIADLAKADIEEVNAAWRGLGYYRRARSLLAGAKTVMGDPKYRGRLPNDPLILEKEIEGVGRYTAGAICSMSYGVRAPIVDGNVHRLFTRLLAVHAPQTAPATIKFLWQAAGELIEGLPKDIERKGIAGDWNQALMELGSQVCKPMGPDCGVCPFQSGCKAYAELSRPPPTPIEKKASCALCAPITSQRDVTLIPSVTVFPMKKEKKASREEEEVVCVTEWRNADKRWWLFVKRPEKGLLAGLFEPPTTAIAEGDDPKNLALATVSSILGIPRDRLDGIPTTHQQIASIPHIFSHINMIYHVHYLLLESNEDPLPCTGNERAVWLDQQSVESANIGTGVKKVWAEIYGSWGRYDAGKSEVRGKSKGKISNGARGVKPRVTPQIEGKVIKKIMMPCMPARIS